MTTRGELIKALNGLQAAFDDYLYSQAAPRLAKHPVELRWEKPFMANCRGLALRTGKSGLIYISPELDPEQRLKTFLHECAHVRLHYRFLADLAQFTPQPGAQPTPHRLTERALTDDVFARREQEAQELAGKWLDQVDGLETVREKLTALISSPLQ